MLFLFIILLLYALIIIYLNKRYPELKWDWNKIDTSKISFPTNFVWGTATASHQVEGGCDNNNWFRWESQVDENDTPRIKDNQKAGIACDNWNLYDKDISLLKKLGVDSYRFSLEWSKIEPSKGNFNLTAIKHYMKVIDSLLKAEITPVITLHHFTEPLWFVEMGGFEKEENIDYFLEFCDFVFSKYSHKVKTWCTINEPEVYSVMGYFAGIFPPGKKDPQLAAIIQKNLLIAHTRVYKSLKNLKNGCDSKIGIVKNVMQFDPYRRYHLFDWIVCLISDKIFNKLSLKYLKTGKIDINIPFFIKMKYEDKSAKLATDFIGLNYYSHNHLKFRIHRHEFFEIKYFNNDIMTDMPYAIYPEGFYRAIKEVSYIGKPIIITENGIADSDDDRRSLFIKRYIYALSKALEEDIPILGYYYWSLMDNFEWAEGYDMKFGLYKVNFKNQKRSLRNGSKAFIDIIKNSKKNKSK